MPDWFKSATWGPLIHGGLVWFVTDGLPILLYLQRQVTDQNPNFNWSQFWIGLAAALLTALISAGRNQGAVTLPKTTGEMVKGIQGTGGSVVAATANEIVRNQDTVLVLKPKEDIP